MLVFFLLSRFFYSAILLVSLCISDLRKIERNEKSSVNGKKRWKEMRDSQERARKHKSMWKYISQFLSLYNRSRIRPASCKSQTSLCFGLLSLCQKREHLTATRRIKPSCKMPARHVWRFVGCICYSKLISARRCRGTKCGVMLWRSDMSLTRPQRKAKRKEKRVHRKVVMEKVGNRQWQSKNKKLKN